LHDRVHSGHRTIILPKRFLSDNGVIAASSDGSKHIAGNEFGVLQQLYVGIGWFLPKT